MNATKLKAIVLEKLKKNQYREINTKWYQIFCITFSFTSNPTDVDEKLGNHLRQVLADDINNIKKIFISIGIDEDNNMILKLFNKKKYNISVLMYFT
jgi:hypothetical protein